MWTVFAFAGAYEWTIVPLGAGAALLAILVRPPVARSRDALVDGAIALSLAAILVQLIPIPAVIRHAISPAAVEFDRAVRLDADDAGGGPARPLTLDPRSTAWAFAVSAAAALVFWSARRIFADGGVRKVVRTAAWTGLLASALAIMQHATAPRLLYWYWRPEATSARPYTPFVNRNDLACWLVMALPLTLGYTIARVVSRRRRNAQVDLASALDPSTVALLSALLVMMGTLLAIESRSGITAAAAGVLAFVVLSRSRIDQARRGWLLVALAALVAAATAYANLDALATRAGDVLTNGVAGRRGIWRETWVMARDFWTTGVGAGAFERGMLVYQTSARADFYFNHAHSEYLQILAEGGLLLALPLSVVLVAGGAEVARRLAVDRSPAGWIRVGAASGLVAVAVQSVWETGLQLPANAVLFAVLAAIALHEG